MIYKKINNKQAETKLYGNIGTWFTNSDTFTALIEDVERSGFEELTIRWHCYGGSVFDGNVIYNALQRTKLKVTIIIDGIAASMGCLILPAIENVYIADNGFGMIHRAKAFVDGDAGDHTSTAKLLNDIEDNFIKRLIERTGLTSEEIKNKWFDGKDHWFNANEMVEFGLAKKVIPATAKNIKALDKEIITKSKIEDIYGKYEACLNTNFNSHNNENQNNMNLISLLIAAFQLEGITSESSETDVVAKLQAKFNALNTEITGLKTQAETEKTNAIKSILDKAQAEGKLMPASGQKIEDVRAVYENVGKTNGIDALATILAGLQTPKSIKDQLTTESAGGDVPKTFEELLAKGETFVAQFKEENRDAYNKLYKAEFGHIPVV